jgi:hypothetical protein
MNMNDDWREIFGPINNRAKDEELIIRFLALFLKGGEYERPMNKFLNDFAAEMNKASTEVMDDLKYVFYNTIGSVRSAIGTRAFRLVRVFNAAVFDSVMVGLAKRLQRGRADSERIVSQYDKLVQDETFRLACERSTADEENVKRRIELATAAFAEV